MTPKLGVLPESGNQRPKATQNHALSSGIRRDEDPEGPEAGDEGREDQVRHSLALIAACVLACRPLDTYEFREDQCNKDSRAIWAHPNGPEISLGSLVRVGYQQGVGGNTDHPLHKKHVFGEGPPGNKDKGGWGWGVPSHVTERWGPKGREKVSTAWHLGFFTVDVHPIDSKWEKTVKYTPKDGKGQEVAVHLTCVKWTPEAGPLGGVLYRCRGRDEFRELEGKHFWVQTGDVYSADSFLARGRLLAEACAGFWGISPVAGVAGAALFDLDLHTLGQEGMLVSKNAFRATKVTTWAPPSPPKDDMRGGLNVWLGFEQDGEWNPPPERNRPPAFGYLTNPPKWPTKKKKRPSAPLGREKKTKSSGCTM